MPTTIILPSTTDLGETAGSLSRANSPTPSNASSTKSIWPSFKRVTSSIGQYAPSPDLRSSLIGSSRKRDSGPDEGMWDKNDDVFLEQIALQSATPNADLLSSPQLSAPLPMHSKVSAMEAVGPLQSSDVDPDIFKSPLFAALHHNQQLPPPSIPLLSSTSPPPQLSKHHQISQWTATSLDAHPYEELSTTSSAHESVQSLSSAPLNLNQSPRGNVSTSPLAAPSRLGGAGGGIQTYKSMSNYSGSGSEASSSVLTFPSPASSRMELDRKAGTNAGLAALSNSTGARLPYDSNIASSETSPTTASFVTGYSPVQPMSNLPPRRHAYKASDDVDRRDHSSKRSSGKSFDDEMPPPSSDMRRPSLASTGPSEPPGVIHHSASSPSMISADVAPWLHMSLDSVKRSRQQQQRDNSNLPEALRSIPAGEDAAKGPVNASVNAKHSHPSWRTRNDESHKDPSRKDAKNQEDAVFIVSADGPSRSTQLTSASVSGETSGLSSRAESPRPKRGFVVGLKKLVQEGTSKGSPKQKPSRKGSLTQGLFYEEEGPASAAATEDHKSSVKPTKSYESDDVHVVSAETTFKNWSPSWGRGAATHDGTIHFPTQSQARTSSKFSGTAVGPRRPSTGSMVSPRADTFGNDVQSSRQVRRPKTSTTTTTTSAVAAQDSFRKHVRSGSVDAQQRSRVDQRRPSTCSSVAESSSRHQPQVGQLLRTPIIKDDGVVRSRSRTGTEPLNKLTRESRTRPSSRASIIEHTSHEDARMRSGVSSGAVPIGSSSQSLRNGQSSRDEDREELIATHPYATPTQSLHDKSEPIIRGVSPMRPRRTMEDAGNDLNPARSSINDAFNAAHDRRWSSTISSPFEKHITPRRGSDAPLPHFFSMGRRGSDTSIRNLPIAKPVAPIANVSSMSSSRSPSSATSPSPRNSALATASTSPPTYSDPWSAIDTRIHSPLTTTKSASSQHGINGSSRREKRRSFVGAASQRLSDLFGSSPSAKGVQSSISRPMSISSQQGLASPPIEQKGDSLPSPTEFVIDKLRRTSQVEKVTPEPIALTAWYASNVNSSKSMQRQTSSSRSVGALSPKEPQIRSPVLHARGTMHQLKGQLSSDQGENRRRSSFGNSFEAGGALHKQRSSSVRPTFGLDMQPDAAAAFDCIPSPGLRSRTFSSSSAPGPAASSLSEFRASLNPSSSGTQRRTMEGAEMDQKKSASEAQMMKMSSPREELRELDPERRKDEQEQLWTKTKHRRGLNRAKEQKWGSMHDTSVNDEEEPEERVKDEEEETEHVPFTSLGLHQDISDADASRPRSRHGSADGSSVPPAFGAAGSLRTSFGSREGRRDCTSLRGSTADAEFTFAPPPAQATVPAADTRPLPADTPSSPGFDELELLDDTGSATGRDLTHLIQEEKTGPKDTQQSSETALVGGLNILVPKEQTIPADEKSKVSQNFIASVRPSTAHDASPNIRSSPLPRSRRPSTSASELGKNDRRSYYTFV